MKTATFIYVHICVIYEHGIYVHICIVYGNIIYDIPVYVHIWEYLICSYMSIYESGHFPYMKGATFIYENGHFHICSYMNLS